MKWACNNNCYQSTCQCQGSKSTRLIPDNGLIAGSYLHCFPSLISPVDHTYPPAMSRKSTSAAVSNRPSTSAAPTSSLTASTQKSSVLKSAFAPSHFQLHLFASVVQSFDSNQLRIHDTTTGRLRCQHESRHGSRITCLDWGYFGTAFQEQRQTPSKKKRKRDQDSNDGAVVAYGTTASEICLFSPAEGKIVGTLAGAHERGVRDFKFSPAEYKEAWSIGEDGTLVQWDLTTCQTTRFVYSSRSRNQH